MKPGNCLYGDQATGGTTEKLPVISYKNNFFLCTQRCPDRVRWTPPSILVNGYREISPWR